MRKNPIRDLIDALRPDMPTLAGWVGVSTWTTQSWRQGTYRPTPMKRAALVKATRKHTARLLALAERVERGERGEKTVARRKRRGGK
jgi:hypothetical protein